MRLIKAGATSQTIYLEVLDSTSTTGARKTGLVFNTSSLTAYYTINGAAAVSISLVTQTVTGAWTSGGFVEVSSANAPGLYRLDIPDASIASGVSTVITLKGATGMVQVSEEIMLVPWNPQDTVRLGLTALPNAAAEAAGGLYTRGSGAGQINQGTNGRVDTNVVAMANNTVTAAAIATDAIDADALATDAITEIWAKAMQDLSAVPGVTASVLDAINWLFELSRNHIIQTATTTTVKKNDTTTTVASSTVSDSAGTFDRGMYS